ncbi:MAG: acyltransferase family protein [Bacteroidia bacterium]
MKPRNLHILRGIAALIVVLYHSKFVLWCGGTLYLRDNGLHNAADYLFFALDMLSSCGKQCVFIFFLLSAFVIKHSFDSNRYPIKIFYLIRAIRIYVPYIFSLLLGVCILYICCTWINPAITTTGVRSYNDRLYEAWNDLSLNSMLKSLAFLFNKEYPGFNIVYWSLLHEAVFYLLFPFYNTLRGLFKKSMLFICMLLIHIFTGSILVYYQLFFIAGLIFYELLYLRQAELFIRIKSTKLQLLLILACYAMINLFNHIFSGEYMADLMTVIFAWLCFEYLLHKKTKVNAFLDLAGKISYSMYLNHFPLLLLIYSFVSLYTGKLIFYSRFYYYSGAVLVILFCYLLYHLAEKQSLKLISHLKRNEIHQPGNASAKP